MKIPFTNITLAISKAEKPPEKRRVYSTELKSTYRVRKDIADWTIASNLATNVENPKRYPLYNLYDDILLDALLTSQIENRRLSALQQPFTLYDSTGKPLPDLTTQLNSSNFVGELNRHIIDTRFFGHSLLEFSYENDQYKTSLIPRQNVIPRTGLIITDYTDDSKNVVKYREVKEYGSWLIEFGSVSDFGLINKVVPHVLFKKFAQSCWSELCEIYGIPPRVMKTDTRDKQMLKRAEQMMSDMGSAAWFIIDETEHFEFATGVATNGDVYKNFINLCNNEISMAISGAIIGQDTVNGNRSKDESARKVLDQLVTSDLSLLESVWNTQVLPALIAIGAIPAGEYKFAYDKAENLTQLWEMTATALDYYDIPAEWIKSKFGIEATAPKAPATPPQKLSLSDTFFS